MHIVQTFWSGTSVPSAPGNKEGGLPDLKAGWLSAEYHWMSWALSCNRLKELYGEVTLVTDLQGKRILIDLLGLPYTHVSTALEGLLDPYPPELWALAKIYTYSLQKEPFIHVDGDVFLWERFNEDIAAAAVVAQNKELNLSLYRIILDEIQEHFTYIPPLFSKERYEGQELYSANAGLIGGNDLAFIGKYCRTAFDLIDRNMDHLKKVNTAHLNFVFEQYLLLQLAEEEQIPITYFMKELVTTPVFEDYIRFEDYPFIKMIHPLGGFKKMQHICNHLSKKLRRDYPAAYYKINDLMQSAGVPMRNRVYRLLDSKEDRNGEDGFERTRACIDHLNAGPALNGHPMVLSSQKIEENDFPAYIHSLLPESIEKDLLLEIFSFEFQKELLFKECIGNLDTLRTLYTNDVVQFARIQQAFGVPSGELLKIRLKMGDHLSVMDTNWGWRYEQPEQIGGIIERNFQTPKVFGQVVFVPSVLQAMIDEYYLDQIDMIIVDACAEEKEIKTLLEVIKPYFNADELNSNLPAFTKLVIESVKRLTYKNILQLVE